MVCQLRNLIYYLHACYAILYPKGMGSGIQAIDKTNELLSVMTVCRNSFHNGAMGHVTSGSTHKVRAQRRGEEGI